MKIARAAHRPVRRLDKSDPQDRRAGITGVFEADRMRKALGGKIGRNNQSVHTKNRLLVSMIELLFFRNRLSF